VNIKKATDIFRRINQGSFADDERLFFEVSNIISFNYCYWYCFLLSAAVMVLVEMLICLHLRIVYKMLFQSNGDLSPYGKMETYTKLEVLGEGSYATVYKGKSK